jgi:hypothetical protein
MYLVTVVVVCHPLTQARFGLAVLVAASEEQIVSDMQNL